MKNKLFIFGAGLTICTFFVLLFFLLLPQLCNALIPYLTKNLPFSHKDITITQITPWKTSGYCRVTDKVAQAVIARFEITYTPSSLTNKEIKNILLQGVHLNILELPPHNTETSSTASQANTLAAILDHFPFSVNAITIDNALIELPRDRKGIQRFSLSSQLLFKNELDNNNQLKLQKITGDITLDGDINTHVNAVLTRIDNKYKARTSFKTDIRRIAELYTIPATGIVNGTASFDIAPNLSTINDCDIAIESNDTTLHYNNFRITARKGSPLVLSMKGTPKQFTFNAHGIHFSTPQLADISLGGTFTSDEKTTTTTGTLSAPLFGSPLTFSLNTEENAFSLDLLGAERGLNAGGTKVTASSFMSHISGEYQEKEFIADATFSMKSLQIPTYTVTAQDLVFKQHLHVLDNAIKDSTGSFTVANILYNKERLLELSGTTALDNEGLQFSTQATTPLHRKLQINCAGDYLFLAPSMTRVECTLPETQVTEKIVPKSILRGNDLHFSGQIASSLKITKSTTLDAVLTTKLTDTTLQFGDKVVLSGINTQLTFPHLPLVQSGPSQIFSIQQAEFGNIKTTDIKIHYRIEDLKNLFIEKSRFSWCRGRVESGSMNINTAKDEYDLTLYCDRLGFTELLGQLGILDAEGTGTLNGRLPLSFKEATLYFDDGFLFSSPGDSGIVRFTNTEKIRQNLGSAPQTGYLDYSINALENFAYNWTTLSFNSVKDDLIISMSLDGKPASPLPYAYNNGVLIPSEQGIGIQHPIHLDVNFHLPSTNIFRYGKNIQSFMEKM